LVNSATEELIILLPIERKDIIRDTIYDRKTVSVIELSAKFNVSTETIRRDLNTLAKEGILTKTYGGAKFHPQVTKKVPANSLKNIMAENKDAMAREAAKYIQQNDCIFLGYSTTVFALCPHIQDIPLTVVTNSLSVLRFFSNSHTIRLESVGGVFIREFDAFSGYHSIENMERYSFDKAFLSCQALNLNKGMCDQNELICGLQEKVLNASNQIYLMADHTKLNQTAYITYGDLSKMDLLITDRDLDGNTKARVEQIGLPYAVAK
jgi:DeoR/GlpR family transcriptional regulator of sugar metabolism